MFKIESYITSIILANADRYIKNFRKQDAQLSLWGGDATFHNIELNIEALNEEVQLPFVFTSGYIHELVIHVPWTKLTSEHVTVFINTIECVVKLRSFEESKDNVPNEKRHHSSQSPSKELHDKVDDVPPPSYISSLMSKIMNNLSINCKNFILKLVEEDIVLSMNIEKLELDNVNGSWKKAFTDMNSDIPLVRKLIDLQGVTICLDKQNSSGRIETYLEPLLYRCPVVIRIRKKYTSPLSKRPISTRIDVYSLKMLFTITEPQVSMLLKLFDSITMGRTKQNDTTDSGEVDDNVSHSSVGCIEFGSSKASEINEEQSSWGYWLWNMMPAILPQEDDEDSVLKRSEPTFSILNMGFYTQNLEIALKFSSVKTKKAVRSDYKSMIKGCFTSCLFQVTYKNMEWMNLQMGAGYVVIEPVYEFKVDLNDRTSAVDRYIISGNPDVRNYLRGTLFDDDTVKPRRKFSLGEYSEDTLSEKSCTLPKENTVTIAGYHHIVMDGDDDDNCSLDKHLSLYTENTLLDKTPALAVDYVRYSVINKLASTAKNDDDTLDEVGGGGVNSKQLDTSENIQRQTLIRFVIGPTVVHVTAGLLQRFQMIHNMIKSSDNFLGNNPSFESQQSKCTAAMQNDQKLSTYPHRTTQYTFFDLNVNLYPQLITTAAVDSPMISLETELSDTESTHLSISSKCIDAKVTHFVYSSNPGNAVNFYQYDFQVNVVGVVGSLVTRSISKSLIAKLEKFEYDYKLHNSHFSQVLRQISINTSKIELVSSKPSLLLTYYISKSLWELWCAPLHSHILPSLQQYYIQLIEDICYSEYGRIVLDLTVTGISVSHKSGIGLQSTDVSVSDCFFNIVKEDVKRRCVAVLVCTENKLHNMFPCLKVTIQNVRDNTANEEISPYPKCIFFELNGFCFNADLLLFKWMEYSPRAKKDVQKINNLKSTIFEKDPMTFSRRGNNNVSRKVSESSSSSYSKRIGTVLSFYPKPKESVHSSFEQEVTSPQTDDILLDPLDTYASSCHMPAPLSVTRQQQFNFANKLLFFYDTWKDLIIYGEIARLKILLPTSSLTEVVGRDKIQPVDVTVKEFVNIKTSNVNNSDKLYGVFVFTFESLKIKSDISASVLSDAVKTIPISLPNQSWLPGKLSFPWTVDLLNLHCFTELESSTKSLLKSFSLSCTISSSMKEQENKPTSLAVYVHFDVQPVVMSVNSAQVLLITNIIGTFRPIYRQLTAKKEISEKLAKVCPVEKADAENNHNEYNGNKLKKITGWIQCTLTKFSFSIYDHLEVTKNREMRNTKLVTEIEDTIISLEFDDVYHKVKLKIATFSADHYIRDEVENCWVKGSFSGLIIKRRASELQNGCVSVEDSNDRFLLATVTRARYSNLQTRLLQSSTSSSVAVANDQFIMEVILNLCSIDIILPVEILQTHLSVMLPLFTCNHAVKSTCDSTSQLGADNSATSFTLPLIYIDTHNLRLFLPSIGIERDVENIRYDTIIFEIGSIYADCDLPNPIIRTYQQPGFNQSSLSLPISAEMNDRQYQVQFTDIFVSTGIWTELEHWIHEESSSTIHAVPGILQQNPAVMWNQGCHPEDSDKTNLQYVSPILAKFSCTLLIAPPLLLKTDRITINATYEINIPFSLEVTLSFPQLILLLNVIRELNEQLSRLLEKQRNISDGKEHPYLLMRNSNPSECTLAFEDSGIESIGQSSVASSAFQNSKKNKLHQKYPHNMNSPTELCATEHYSSRTSKQNTSTDTDVFISIADVTVILYTASGKTGGGVPFDKENLIFKPLFLCHLSQPHLLCCRRTEIKFSQVSCSHVKLKLPTYDKDYTSNVAPNVDDFPVVFMETKTRNKEAFTGVSYPCFFIELTHSGSVTQKIDIKICQPVYTLLNVGLLNSVDNLFETCVTEYRRRVNAELQLFNQVERKTSYCTKSAIQSDIKRSLIMEGRAPSCCNDNIVNATVSTSQLIFILRSNNEDGIGMLLSVTNVYGDYSFGSNLLTGASKTDVNLTLEAFTLATFQSPSANLYDSISERLITVINLQSVLIIQPTDVKFQFATGCAMCDCAEKYFKFSVSDIIANVTPFYVLCIERTLQEFGAWLKASTSINNFNTASSSSPFSNDETLPSAEEEKESEQLYVDDLRAGAFHGMKVSEDMSRLPLAYELVFCDCSGSPYMIWKYPQPRTIIKLHMFPIVTEHLGYNGTIKDVNCELQYYNEISFMFEKYVDFKLSDEYLQKIPLPANKIDMQISTCWRIILQCPVLRSGKKDGGKLRNSIDISSLSGCVQVDSLYQADLLPYHHVVMNVSALQVNFSAYQNSKKEPVFFENYLMNNSWMQHNLFSIRCEECNVNIINRPTDYLLKFTSKIKTYILNYQYLMYQIFTEPFSVSVTFHRSKETLPKLTVVLGSVAVHISQNVAHTLSIFHWLWTTTCDVTDHLLTRIKMTAPYVICNNTNCAIVISQDMTKEQIRLAPGWCHLYSWYTPFLPDVIRLTVLYRSWKLQSSPVSIRNSGASTVSCVTEDNTVICLLLVTVTKISPVVRKVVLEGHLRIFNQTDMKIDAIAIATDPDSTSIDNVVLTDSLQTMYSASYIEKKSLSSMIIPLNYNLTMKVRDAVFPSANSPCNWSGLIPIKLARRNNNKSWLVKVPLKESKDHFQSMWCDVIEETVDESPRLLVLFKPLCLLQSYLPWKTHLKVLDEKGCVVSNILVGDNGSAQDLFIPDTVTLDNFCIQWQQREDVQNTVSLTLVKPFSKPDLNCSLPSIENLLKQIELFKCTEKCRFIRDATSNMEWMTTDNVCSITPNIKINQKQKLGMGLYVEIYPQIIITNTLGRAICLNINNSTFTIEQNHVFIPPTIENTFKLSLQDGLCCYSSGPLSLSEEGSGGNASKENTDIPLTGYVSAMINCNEHITFVNMKSKILDDMRTVDICSPYVITNYSSQAIIKCSAFVICRTNAVSNAPVNIPTNLTGSYDLVNTDSPNAGIPIVKWTKIGEGDTQILPYLLFTLGTYTSCPVRVCDLSEKLASPLLFSTKKMPHSIVPATHPSLCIIAQHKDGQIFISIYDECTPHITIHNETSLTLNVASSKTEQGNQVILDSSDWKWRFYSLPKTVSHYRIHHNFNMQDKSKKPQPYLVFTLRSDYRTKDIKWSKGIRLDACRKELIILALSQQHITVSIFKNGFTYVVLIEPATMTDLPCTNVRKQLLQTHFVAGKDSRKVEDKQKSENHDDEDLTIPTVLKNYYNTDTPDIIVAIRICVRALAVILVSDNTITDDNDVATFTLDNIIVYNSNDVVPKKDEVKSESTFTICIGSYQLDNGEHRYNAYDFPVMLINKPDKQRELDYDCFKQPSEDNVNRLVEQSGHDSSMAAKIITNVLLSQFHQFDVRDVQITFAHQQAYIEDKYIARLRSLVTSISYSVTNNDIFVSSGGSGSNNNKPPIVISSNNANTSYNNTNNENQPTEMNKDLIESSAHNEKQRLIKYENFQCNSVLIDKCDSIVKLRSIQSRTFISPTSNASSKSVNVSEYGDAPTDSASNTNNNNNNQLSTQRTQSTSERDDFIAVKEPIVSDNTSNNGRSFVDGDRASSFIVKQQTGGIRPDDVSTGSSWQCDNRRDIDDNNRRVYIPDELIGLSFAVSHPIKLRTFRMSPVHCTVSLHTSTSFYVALDNSPLHFSEFTRHYLIVSPYELGQLLTVHYMMGAIYGSGWAISSLEFVGSPGGLARTVSTGIKDFVSLPIYGIASGPQGFVLGIANGSASLLKHLMAGTLTSVTKFAGSWARTLDRFTLDSDDLIQSEEVRRRPPTNITEGIVQGLTEFGISLLGGISGIAHHPLQYVISETTDRSLFGSVSLGLVGMITRPLSGAAELVARTGQGILSHVGWNTLPKTKHLSSANNNTAVLFNTTLRYRWKNIGIPNKENILFITDGAIAVEKIKFISLILTNEFLYVNEAETDELIDRIKLHDHHIQLPVEDGTLITVSKIIENYEDQEKYNQLRIKTFIEETNKCLGIESPYVYTEYAKHYVCKLYVNPDIRNYMETLIKFVKSHTVT